MARESVDRESVDPESLDPDSVRLRSVRVAEKGGFARSDLRDDRLKTDELIFLRRLRAHG